MIIIEIFHTFRFQIGWEKQVKMRCWVPMNKSKLDVPRMAGLHN